MKKYRIGIVGATGAVGQEIIRLLEARNFPVAEARLLASSRSAGREIQACGNLETVREASPKSFEGLDFAIFSAGGAISADLAGAAVAKNCLVIDNSSAFRMEPKVPLVVPEINPAAASRHKGIIANPNCTTTVALMALYPLHKRFELLRFFASTYQAVSGVGTTGLEELEQQTKALIEGAELTTDAFPHPIAFNLIPHVDEFRDDGYTREELKMRNESRKILDLPDLQVSCTCVRVPVFRTHSISINAEFERPVNVPDAHEAIDAFPGAEVQDQPKALQYPMPLACTEQEACGVGRVRIDHGFANGLALWVAGDQLWKGAALNAVQIAELLIERNWLRLL